MVTLQDAHYIDQFTGKVSDAESGGLNYLEQLTALAVDCCPNVKAPVLAGVDHIGHKAHYHRAGCKQWSCITCGPRNARRWIARLLYGMNELGGEWSFVTFTAHEKMRGDASLKNIRQNWPKLRKRMARAIDHEFAYVWVYERHKDKSWHVHMLYSAHLKSRWWKDNARACGMGYQCKDEPLDNYGQAVGYVAKYLLKQMVLLPPYPKDMRRITTSRNFPQLPEQEVKDDSLAWSLIRDRKHLEQHSAALSGLGYEITGRHSVRKQYDKLLGDGYPF